MQAGWATGGAGGAGTQLGIQKEVSSPLPTLRHQEAPHMGPAQGCVCSRGP